MKKTASILWGVILIALGIILGVNALGIARINIFFPGWWTLLIIVPSFVGLFSGHGSRSWNFICLFVGVCLLLACQGVMSFGILWKMMLPMILVVLGLSIIFKDGLRKQIAKEMKEIEDETKGGDSKEFWAIFGGQNVNFAHEKFEGCRLEAVFGGVKCDLREAKITHDVVVRASAVFGGVTILVPENVNIQVVSTGIFGGTDNKFSREKDAKQKTIYVETSAVFGGVEIK